MHRQALLCASAGMLMYLKCAISITRLAHLRSPRLLGSF
jgi:hypothetical protein